MIEVLIFLFTAFAAIFFYYTKFNGEYFKRKGVPYIPGNPIFGNITDFVLSRTNPTEMATKWYNHPAGKDKPYVGMRVFQKNVILVKDPELVKQVMIKDFNQFNNRFTAADVHSDPLAGGNLFFARGKTWKQLRTKLTPVFTSGKLKQMFPLIDDVGVKLENYVEQQCGQQKCMELKSLCSQYTTDVIATIAFGLEANSFQNPKNEFRMAGLSTVDFSLKRALHFSAVFFIPKIVSMVGAKVVPQKAEKIFRDTFTYVMEERKRTGSFRNDLVDILVALQKQSLQENSELKFTDDLLLAQATVFFLAGFETSSSAMSFALYELAHKPELQKRLRKEINDVYERENGKVTYEAINGMEYMGMVLSETLRLYSTFAYLDREVTTDSKGYSLQPFGDFVMPPGMPVFIPTAGLHRDPKYFPNPLEFDPERFSSENKRNIVSGTYLPFGLGGHNCIGERMGLLQAKVGLFHLLRKHFIKLNAKTETPIRLNKKALIIQTEGGIYLDIVKA